ncbi:hypothetical protein ARHIZOSPH14_10910 [Agromyces rhizosphaerae]|uniref:Flp family type IVb pilin n=1 Tax=Agromyces rhizosphaerae TaxID=88374 RepID=A0A9W6FND3_9MICO|nr:Flp family type IVb pilin [Agromyces rhizosphaerae]GLI26849.1 hypothetical protein ARHIZOSPH14_10910 [Agromyces rhizosphaerae]
MLKFFVTLQSIANSIREDEKGNAAEYGLIIAIVALGIIVGLGVLAAALNGLFNDVAAEL